MSGETSNGVLDEPMPREWAVEELQENLAGWRKYGYGPWSAIHKETGRSMGKIDLSVLEDWPEDDRRRSAGSFWGQGLATEGGRAALRYGFTELELSRIISVTTPTNVASWRVMEKCGLIYQGRIHRRDVDCVWYALDRAEWLGHGPR
jgi:[ribosomal protein S5]-alanine N-acetyltransferase